MAALTLILFFVFAVLDWIAVANDWKAGEWVAKPATLALLTLYAGLQPEVTWVLLAALIFSLLGDVYLMLPNDSFIAGLSAFLIGHVFYVLSFTVDPTTRAIWLIVLLILSGPLAFKILGAAPERMRPPIAIYMLAIAAMVASAFASASFAAIVGALLFYASDSMIAWSRFVDPFPGARVAIIVTYHLGQLGLVWGLT